MDREGDEIIISFQLVPPHEKQDQIESNVVGVELKQEENEKDTPSLSYPKFRKRSIMEETCNFESETAWLAFKFNLGNAPFTKEKQDRLLNMIYDNQQMFSLHDEDLGFCNELTHTIQTMTDRPVYLPHRMILQQLQVKSA